MMNNKLYNIHLDAETLSKIIKLSIHTKGKIFRHIEKSFVYQISITPSVTLFNAENVQEAKSINS